VIEHGFALEGHIILKIWLILRNKKIKIKITGPEISTGLMPNDCINLFNACSNPGHMKL